MIRNKLQLIFLVFIMVALAACSSIARKWKSIVSGGSEGPPSHMSPGPTSFSSNPNLNMGRERKYKRVTKDNFSDEQALEENAGSLWRKEGQGSYLFSQNNLRLIGDIINVEIDGKAADNLNVKLDVIKKALTRLEAPPAPVRIPASPTSVPRPEGKNPPGKPTPPAPQPENQQAQGTEGEKAKDVRGFGAVACRIVEKNIDGSYRVKGQDTIIIGKREYKLIVTGNVRPDDIAEGGVPSSKVIDSKFDLVASNKDVSR